MYAIQATVTMRTEGTSIESTTQIPTFFLDENVQGITDETAATGVAFEILARPLACHTSSRFLHARSLAIGGFVFTYNITASRVSYRALY